MTDAEITAIEKRNWAAWPVSVIRQDFDTILAEVKRLRAITDRLRTCYACAKPYVSSRAGDFEEEEPDNSDKSIDNSHSVLDNK